MKKTVLLFITLAVTLTATHAQALKNARSIKAAKVQNAKSHKMLNPQPLPPKEAKAAVVQRRADNNKLNPQPLPPSTNKSVKTHRDGSQVMLNRSRFLQRLNVGLRLYPTQRRSFERKIETT